MKFNFGEEAKKAESGSYFKPKDGNNVVRIVTEFVLYESSFQGKPTRKFVGYLIDRSDKAIKPAFLAKTIIDKIADLQMSGPAPEGYGFDGVPMPYDINIKATGAGTKDVEYSVIPARTETPLTEEELKAISELSVRDYLTELQNSDTQKTPQQNAPLIADPTGFIKPEDIAQARPSDEETITVEDIPFA